jgi:hypothetical protein
MNNDGCFFEVSLFDKDYKESDENINRNKKRSLGKTKLPY